MLVFPESVSRRSSGEVSKSMTEPIKAVIGQYADYYIEWDGMVEIGPGCMERIQTRIDALPDGHPSKVQLMPKEDE